MTAEEACLKNCKRLGIMGGTFDPIHHGHLLAAEAAREAYDLDKVLFIPTGRPVFKLDRKVATGADRYEMTRRAIAGNPFFLASRMEIDRQGVTYTIDTIDVLRGLCPGELFFITGSDAARDVGRWKDAERLLSLCTFVAVKRPGYRETPRPGVRFLEAPVMEVSSSEIRERVAAGRSIKYLVPAAVEGYILGNGLYREACVP